ncbi:MAG: hypothetical protein B6229_07435 [Spirochaetaceae bacterium 4572_7]|nr:MAG: hypothetical protein B6229_07435 [Spirochaetaceae bacterium 4572_7]
MNEKELEYDLIGQFSEGLCPVMEDNKWGAINKDNEVVIPFEYDYLGQFNDGLCPVIKDGKYGAINKDNEIVIKILK